MTGRSAFAVAVSSARRRNPHPARRPRRRQVLQPDDVVAGRHAAGRHLAPTSGRPPASASTISLRARRPEVSTDETYAVKWLSDSRRVVYFTTNGIELVVLDTVTRTAHSRRRAIAGTSHTDDLFAISRDNRTIYYGAARAEADIWIVERTSSPTPNR